MRTHMRICLELAGRPGRLGLAPAPKLSCPTQSIVYRAKKREQWSEESMQAALGAVKSGVSVLRTAREHGVPRQTLRAGGGRGKDSGL